METVKKSDTPKIHRNMTVVARTVEQFESIARAGFWGVDISISGYARREDLSSGEYEKELAARSCILNGLGLSVGQTHLSYWPAQISPLGDDGCEIQNKVILPIIQREIELTAQMGCRLAVMHPFFARDGRDREVSRSGNLRLIEALLPTLERCGVTLALENIYGANASDAHHEHPEDLLYYTQRFSSPYLGVCLDTGHACMRGQDPISMVHAYGNHLRALHLHTSLFGRDNHAIPCVVVGDPVDWRAFCAALDEIGFTGNFNLEVKPFQSLPLAALDAYYQLAYAVAKDLTK